MQKGFFIYAEDFVGKSVQKKSGIMIRVLL